MKTVVYPSQLKANEENLMNLGASEDELILRAATALSNKAIEVSADGEILVVAGKGNNGCDGLEAARILSEKGKKVRVFAFGGNEGNLKRIETLKALGVPFVSSILGDYELIVDCIFGIGLTRRAEGEYAKAITAINESKALVLSADVPSGLNALTGEAYDTSVEADYTLTFSFIKSGLILGEGIDYCGKIEIAEIGIPCSAVGFIVDEIDAALPKRKRATHKGNYGRVSVIGGCENMVGAPLMSFESAVAAARAGAGLTTLCVPEEAKCAYQARVKETMLNFLPSKNGKIVFNEYALRKIMESSNSIAVGMGMGKSDDTARVVSYLAKNFDGTLVIDADGLNSIASDLSLIENATANLILTPHIGEFNRLERSSGELIERAKNLAKKLNAVIAVKSATTILTDGNEVYFNLTGTPALAKGGSGDVLAGMTAALSCVLSPLKAAVSACYHFGKAAKRAEKRLNSETSVLASDVIIELAKE